jgi:GNAT superfamily N-acetyltransferase
VTDQRDELRLAGEGDLSVLREIVHAAYAPYLARMARPPAPLRRDLRPDVDAGRVWVAGRPIAGLICLVPGSGALLVENVAVHPDAQGTGLGRQLMDFARRLGFGRLWLYTNEVMTENIAIYTHLGYHEIDRRTQDGYRRVFMEKILAPGVKVAR